MNQKIKFFIKIVLIFAGIFLGIFVAFKLAGVLVPFVIAFALSTFIEPLVGFLMKRTKLSRKVSTVISLLSVLSVFGVLMALLITRIYKEAYSLSKRLPEYIPEVYNNVTHLVNKASEFYLGLPKEVIVSVENMISNLSDSASKWIKAFAEGILSTAFSLPQALIFVIVTILATFFMASDKEKIYDYLKLNVPEVWVERTISIKDDMFMALLGYIKAQLIMMTITFFELSIGFYFIGLKHFILLATIIAFIDAFPILGTGGILIPWALYEVLTSDYKMAISLIGLYLFVLVVRQLIEPKILGQQIGLHPLVTLMSMYLGLQVFSYIGLIIGPVTILLVKNILTGILKNRSLKEFIVQYKKESS